jgi:hypothetical protein
MTLQQSVPLMKTTAISLMILMLTNFRILQPSDLVLSAILSQAPLPRRPVPKAPKDAPPKGKLDVGESLANLGFERGLLALASSLKPSGPSASEVTAWKDFSVQQEEAIKLGQKQQEELEGLNSSLGMLGDTMDNLADKIRDSVARALVGILGKK